ncbi:DinB family protein [Oceanobacillus sp. CFH 90083]|uniref:DinB family protein n=1 Tax=Oceanobacillus sp. CFH 90083 TaxID=2592336 RepID=UPI0018838A95|nr:DinB family protein [Oceanobacillus sp. CFH 90083]
MAGKKEIMQHHMNAIKFVRALHALSEDQWRTPVEKGKWTVAEVIGHLIPWDEFVLYKRMPYLFSDDKLPKGSGTDATNTMAASKAREQDKEIIIDKFILVRSNLLQAMDNIPPARWHDEVVIGETRLNLSDYFNGLVKHDVHHFEQVKAVIQQSNK